MNDITGLSGAAVGKTEMTVDGKTYLVGPWTLRDYATVEKHFIRIKRKRRQQMTLDLRDEMPPDLWDKEWAIAKEEAAAITNVDPVEFGGAPPEFDDEGNVIKEWQMGWMDSIEGKAFTAWVLFEKAYPGKFSLEKMTDMLEIMGEAEMEEMMEARDQTMSKDLLPEVLKNSEGSTALTAVEPKDEDEPEENKASVGSESSGN